MLGLIWIQTACHPDAISKIFFVNVNFEKNQKGQTHWLMYTLICWYLRVLPVLHRPDVVDIPLCARNNFSLVVDHCFWGLHFVVPNSVNPDQLDDMDYLHYFIRRVRILEKSSASPLMLNSVHYATRQGSLCYFIILISDCYASLMMLDRDHYVILLY